jgi:lipopolysaccharide/colanic/teichoic acid biosynthesis glycosyltransferase
MSRGDRGVGPQGAPLKRAFDVVGASAGLVVSAPVLGVVAVLIKLTSRGPVLFRLTAVGKDGRRFRMLKFRTMQTGTHDRLADLADRNAGSGPMIKVIDDPRITGLGRWLRMLSLDELPQLINVVRGEMSLVGPRPIAADLYDARYLTGPYAERLSVPPGMTGLWQVSGRSQDFDVCCSLDTEYIRNWSFGLDIRILVRTVRAVLSARGAR